jgi:hypothetical protein
VLENVKAVMWKEEFNMENSAMENFVSLPQYRFEKIDLKLIKRLAMRLIYTKQ